MRTASDAPLRRVEYSPALDGLRGLSVLLVLAYHLGVSWAVGGFVGVDVFFVVSGYLITALLLAEHGSTGTVDLGAFWARRVRRLLPSVFALVVAVVIAERVWPTFHRPATLRADALSVLGYVSNWRFILSGSSYFEQYATPSPLRHTWSLAIEEQWYFVWPLIVAVVARYGRQLLGGLALVLVVVSASAMVVLYTPGSDPSRSYYGTDSRAQALLVGSGLAIAMSTRALDRARRIRNGVVAAIDVAAVIFMAWVVRTKPSFDPWFYEGGATLVAFVSAVLVWRCVTTSTAGGTSVARALACRPLVAIGLRSYAIYVWHWPVIIYCNGSRVGVHGTQLTIVRVAVTLALAECSFRVVENPIRRSQIKGLRLLLGGGAVAAVFVVVMVPVSRGPGDAGIATPNIPTPSLGTGTGTGEAGTAPVRVLVVGDSVAFRLMYHWSRDATLGLEPRGAAVIGCGVAGGSILRDGRPVPPPPECNGVDEVWTAALDQYQPEVVVAMYGPLELQDRVVDGVTLRVGTEAYRAYLRERLEHDVDVVTSRGAHLLLTDVPCFGTEDAVDAGIGTERADERRIAVVNEIFKSVADRDPTRITLLPIAALLCPNGQYQSRSNGVQMRDDGVHFTPEGAHVTWSWLAPAVHAAVPG